MECFIPINNLREKRGIPTFCRVVFFSFLVQNQRILEKVAKIGSKPINKYRGMCKNGVMKK
jgi:hypothetical protein